MVVLKALRTIINSLLVLKHSHTPTLNYNYPLLSLLQILIIPSFRRVCELFSTLKLRGVFQLYNDVYLN